MTKLIVVSNRLPVTLTKDDTGYHYTKSSGGLVSALSAAKKDFEFIWFGWPGIDVPEDDRKTVMAEMFELHQCVPVFLETKDVDLFYNGFSNEVIWPLFHYFPEEVRLIEDQWKAYFRVNQKFADTIKEHCSAEMIFWVHDYQLMLLPRMLRETYTQSKIGFFLHIPFLSSEIYGVLPVREAILDGILGSDLIGFHTFEYARHFVSASARLLKAVAYPDRVVYHGRTSEVAVIPIGIDPNEFLAKLDDDSVSKIADGLRARFKQKRILLGVDRLDYIKGIPNKLLAFKHFLSTNPEYIGNVVLLQVAIPSRTNVTEYQKLRAYCNEIAGEINGTFGISGSDNAIGKMDYLPIHLIHKSLTHPELLAVYKMADVCIITSIRDGMNLVAYEYLTCKNMESARLILSEFAGCAQSLQGVRLINPWNIIETSQAIRQVLEQLCSASVKASPEIRDYIWKHTSAVWCQRFMQQLMHPVDGLSREIFHGMQYVSMMEAQLGNKEVGKYSFGKTAQECDSPVLREASFMLQHYADINTRSRLLQFKDAVIFDFSLDTMCNFSDIRHNLTRMFPQLSVSLDIDHGFMLAKAS